MFSIVESFGNDFFGNVFLEKKPELQKFKIGFWTTLSQSFKFSLEEFSGRQQKFVLRDLKEKIFNNTSSFIPVLLIFLYFPYFVIAYDLFSNFKY